MGTVKEADIVIAKFDYKATDSQELDIQKGEKLTLMDDTQHWWKVMNSFGNVGYVPSNYVKRSKQGLFSSLRNTLGRRKSRTDLPMPATGTSTGGRPPASTQSSTRNGNGNTGSKAGVKASVESLDYVAPSLPSSGSGQSPTRGTAASIGYQPVSSAFPTNGTTTILDNSRSCSALPPSSHQLPPTHPGMSDTSPSKVPIAADNVALSNPARNGPSNNKINWSPTSSSQVTSGPSAETQPYSSARNTVGGTGGSISSRQICVARFTYKASQPDELTIKPGDRICILDKSSDGWWHGMLLPPDGDGSIDPSGQKSETVGWFPSNYVGMEQTSNNHWKQKKTNWSGKTDRS
ncbi:unnamed protein product [Hymenolepis diminuta]|uniref:SH3 domain-containing protein n=1 Tax=Hymenolepis diminuta TaxID=6216 RepID=A0A564Y6N3_HYMDI|nr:unnamed protein product [Hymenolepis diminuta]